MNILVSREVTGVIPTFVSYMKGKGLPRMAVENYKNGFIGFLRNYFLSANPAKSGYCYYRIPADKNVWTVSYRMYPMSQSVEITGIVLRELMDGGQSQEGGGYVARLAEEDLRRMVKKAVRKVLGTLGRDNRCTINEEAYIHPKAKPIKLGEWDEIDSLPLDTILTGFEDKGYVLPQCLFLNTEKNEGFGLYKRADNNKYFYLKLVPDENNVITYVSVKRSDVPKVILSDFPQYLRRTWERIRPIIEKER